jgi:hypothetical protein
MSSTADAALRSRTLVENSAGHQCNIPRLWKSSEGYQRAASQPIPAQWQQAATERLLEYNWMLDPAQTPKAGHTQLEEASTLPR